MNSISAGMFFSVNRLITCWRWGRQATGPVLCGWPPGGDSFHVDGEYNTAMRWWQKGCSISGRATAATIADLNKSFLQLVTENQAGIPC